VDTLQNVVNKCPNTGMLRTVAEGLGQRNEHHGPSGIHIAWARKKHMGVLATSRTNGDEERCGRFGSEQIRKRASSPEVLLYPAVLLFAWGLTGEARLARSPKSD